MKFVIETDLENSQGHAFTDRRVHQGCAVCNDAVSFRQRFTTHVENTGQSEKHKRLSLAPFSFVWMQMHLELQTFQLEQDFSFFADGFLWAIPHCTRIPIDAKQRMNFLTFGFNLSLANCDCSDSIPCHVSISFNEIRTNWLIACFMTLRIFGG